MHAPHLKVSVVHPGHVGTSIVLNSAKAHERDAEGDDTERLARVRQMLAGMGTDVSAVSDEDLRKGMQMMGESFRDNAPLSAADAATIILDGVREERWRILVGADAEAIDAAVREDPEGAYDPAFYESLRHQGLFGGFGV
jgi:hypothetical protein